MAFTHSESDGLVRTVYLDEPRLADELTLRQVQDELLRLLAETQERHVLLHFGKVTFLSSSGLGMLVRLHKKSKDSHISLKLCNVDKEIERVFQATGLAKILDIYRDAADAIRASCRRALSSRVEGDPFRFAPALFMYRNKVIAALRKRGFGWVSHHYSVNILHDVYGIEVGGIRYKRDAMTIRGILLRMFPEWVASTPQYYPYRSEPGWIVSVQRKTESA